MKLRIAGIGAGRRAAAHFRALAGVANAEIVAMCDVDEERAQQVAGPLGAQVYTDFMDMLDSEQPDAVYIVTPPAVHAEQVEYAATQKAGILLEKPIALSVLDARRIRLAVEQGRIVCAVGYQLRYSPLVERCRELLEGRQLAMARIWWYQGLPTVGWNLDAGQGGGQVVEQATHWLDLCRWLGGEVERVYAQYARRAWQGRADFKNWDVNAVTLTFSSGALGSLASTYALFPGLPEHSGLDLVCEELLLRLTSRRLEVFTPKGREGCELEPPPLEERMARAFLAAVEARDTRLVASPLDDALKTLALTLACNRSAQENRVVPCAEVEKEIFG
jgi:predicted dehydrogenase